MSSITIAVVTLVVRRGIDGPAPDDVIPADDDDGPESERWMDLAFALPFADDTGGFNDLFEEDFF